MGKNNTQNKRCTQKGFTLIEVLFALVIAAISLGAITFSISNYYFGAYQTKEKTFSSWATMNRIVAVKYTSNKQTLDRETELIFNREYASVVKSVASDIPGLSIIEVQTYAGDNDEPSMRMLSLKSLVEQ